MSLLAGFRVVQIGDGLAAAVCGRLFADTGAEVCCIEPDNSTHLSEYLNHGKTIVASDAAGRDALVAADLIVFEGRPRDLLASNTTAPVFGGSTRRRRSFSSRPLDKPGPRRTIRRPI